MERYESLFAQLKERKEGAFVPFVTLGDPGIEQSLKIIDTLIEAGADVIAFDGTQRKRPNGAKLEELIKYIKINKRISMADISTFEEGVKAAEAGVDLISTTLSGYTVESLGNSQGPDFELLDKLVKNLSNIILASELGILLS